MTRCPETLKLLEAGLDPSEHCDTCRAFSQALSERHDDLERALDAFAAASDTDDAVARALEAVPLGPQAPQSWDRRFHGSLIGAAAILVLIFIGIRLLAPPPPPPEAPVEQRLATEIESVEALQDKAWSDLSLVEWGSSAMAMRRQALRVQDEEDLSDPDVRAVLFDLWVQAGRAAENANDPAPPHYDMVEGKVVNMAWYRAGSLAHADPSLASRIQEGPLSASVAYYRDAVEEGRMPDAYAPVEPRTPPPAPVPNPGDPEEAIGEAATHLARVEAIASNELSSQQWSDEARTLRGLGMRIETSADLDEPEARAALFEVWTQAGRAADNSNNPAPPHFRLDGSRLVNDNWHRAAGLAVVDPSLLEAIPEGDLRASVSRYADRIDKGELPNPYRPGSANPGQAP